MKSDQIIVIEMAGDKLLSLMAAAARGETKRASRLGADIKLHMIERLTPKLRVVQV